jgi:hypothetical protein
VPAFSLAGLEFDIRCADVMRVVTLRLRASLIVLSRRRDREYRQSRRNGEHLSPFEYLHYLTPCIVFGFCAGSDSIDS